MTNLIETLRKPSISAIVTYFVFWLLAMFLLYLKHQSSFYRVDFILVKVATLAPEIVIKVAGIVSNGAYYLYFAILASLVTVAVIKKNLSYGLLTLVNLIINMGVLRLIKELVKFPRPITIEANSFDKFSFPSLHSSMTVMVVLTLAHIISHTKYAKYSGLTVFIGAILTVIVSMSRVVLGVHYSSDVLAGILLALGLFSLTTSMVKLGNYRIMTHIKSTQSKL